jgi:two-component system, NarL family, sensor histidine kinase BarA
MNILRKVITGVGLAVVIPALVIMYISSNPSVFILSSRNIIILIVAFISILGVIVFWNFVSTIASLSNSLKVIAKGDINHQAKVTPENDIEELTDSINQLSRKMRLNADELEKRAILIERFNQEVKRMSNLRFMYPNIVHELRTPLINIEKSSSLLLERNAGHIDAQDEEFIVTINKNAKRLFRLVDNLLDISKMEAGQLTLNFEKFPVPEAVHEAVKSLDNWRQSKNIQLEVKIDEDIPLVYASRDRIIQVLVNLISNAIKFTPAGGKITVWSGNFISFAEAGITNPEDKFVGFSVEDNGTGIPENLKQMIFERYKTASGDSFDNLHSTGLGLPIAKEIAEMHGGRIWLDNRRGKGSKFSFIIPQTALGQDKIAFKTEEGTAPGGSHAVDKAT